MAIWVALDLSKSTGFAVDSDMPGRPESGVWKLPGGQEDYGLAGYELAQRLGALIVLKQPAGVIYEKPLDPRNLGDSGDKPVKPGYKPRKRFMASFETIRLLIGLAMAVEMVVEKYRRQGMSIECHEAYVQSWRSCFTGTQKGGKDPTKARCAQLRWPFRDDNEADALGIWMYAQSTTDPKWRPCPGP